jgi:hypothetical protein
MKQALIYSLKVWLSSCVVTPVIFAMLRFHYFGVGSLMFLPLSIIFIILATILTSSLTWFVFYLSIRVILKYSDVPTRRLKILIVGEGLILLTFWLFLLIAPGFDGKVYTVIMLFHCLIIGCGIWFYKLYPATPSAPIQR